MTSRSEEGEEEAGTTVPCEADGACAGDVKSTTDRVADFGDTSLSCRAFPLCFLGVFGALDDEEDAMGSVGSVMVV